MSASKFSMRAPLLALMLLTRLPVRLADDAGADRLRDATGWFPLAGLIVGLLAGIVGWAVLALHLPPSLAALACLAAGIALTGALHEDGLADTADSAGAGEDRTRALLIMKDSRIGSYGAIALFLALAARLLTLSQLAAGGGAMLLIGAVAAGAASRGLLPLIMRMLPTARPGGLGAAVGRPTRGGVRLALLIGCLPALILLPIGTALIVLFATGLATLLLLRRERRRLGGFTGDTLGALQQAGEIAALIALTALSAPWPAAA